MLLDQYVQWFDERVEALPYTPIPSPTASSLVDVDWPLDAFRCDAHGCSEVCCRTWSVRDGVPLLIGDLLRLQAGGLLESAHGQYSSSIETKAFIADPESAPSPKFVRLKTHEHGCCHYDPETTHCRIYEHRPSMCRTFPYSAEYQRDVEVFIFRMTGRCSLAPQLLQIDGSISQRGSEARMTLDANAIETASMSGPASQPATARGTPAEPHPLSEFLSRRVPFDHLPDYDRRHLEECIASRNDQARTIFIIAERPELLSELGLRAYAGELDRSEARSPAGSRDGLTD